MQQEQFGLTQEHLMVVEAAQGMAKKLAPKMDSFNKMIFEEQRFPEEIWKEMANAGILGAMIPEEYGGTGVGLLAMTLALETLATEGIGASLFAVLTTMDTMAILKGGSEDQKQAWLPKIANGDIKMAFAITEPDAGTNSFRMKTLARKEGGVYRINGQKAWITGFDVADYALIVARTMTLDELKRQGLPKSYGMGLFIVDTKAQGITANAMNTMGIEGFRQFQIYFDDVEVPVENRVGEEHMGAMALFYALNPERILAAAGAVGMSEFALRKSVAYALERKVWSDAPIGSYQGVQHPLAHIKARQEAIRLLTYKAAWAFDKGLPPAETGGYANMAKLLASELAVDAIDRAIQTHGGNGFVTDYQLIRMWAPARLLKTAPINNEMVMNFIAEHVLGLPKSY